MTLFTLDRIDNDNRVMYSLEGDELKYDVAVVVPHHRGPNIKFKPEGIVDDEGFIVGDKYTNNIKGYDDAFVIGDASTASHAKTGVTAHLQAEVVANRLLGFNAKNTGRTHCPFELGYGVATFIISDYEHAPLKVQPSKFKYVLKLMFANMYWDVIKYPELWNPVFEAYLEATNPKVLAKIYR